MLKAKKKISKRVIKEDKLVTTYFEAQTWYEENKKRLRSIGGTVLVLVAAGWFYYNNVQANNENATTDLAKVFAYYDNGQYQTAIDGIPEKNVRGLQSIVDNYGSTHAGNLAKFYLAGAYYNLQNYDKALEYFDDYDGGNPLLEVSALAGVGACYEAKGDFQKAAEYFERAALKNANDPNVAENLLSAARDYVKAGNKERAMELFRKIKKDFPASAAARDIERYMAEVNT